MTEENSQPIDSLIINEIQLALAEKRTALAFMRTGFAVFVLPLTVLSALIATSEYYEFLKVLYFMIPLLIICAGLIGLGLFLVIRAIVSIRRHDRAIYNLKKNNERLSKYLS